MKVGRGLDFGLTFMVLLFNCSDLYIMGTITCIYVVFGISSLDVSCGCQSDCMDQSLFSTYSRFARIAYNF